MSRSKAKSWIRRSTGLLPNWYTVAATEGNPIPSRPGPWASTLRRPRQGPSKPAAYEETMKNTNQAVPRHHHIHNQTLSPPLRSPDSASKKGHDTDVPSPPEAGDLGFHLAGDGRRGRESAPQPPRRGTAPKASPLVWPPRRPGVSPGSNPTRRDPRSQRSGAAA